MSPHKQVSFKIPEKRLLDFKIKLRHDGLTHSGFFHRVIELYVADSKLFSSCIEDIRDNCSKLVNTKKNKISALSREGQRISSSFEMSEEDKNKIYSLLEEEVGDL